MRYRVAFVGTREAGGHEGIVTWTSYTSKEAFDASHSAWPEDTKRKQRVLEEGISEERCLELVRATPVACRVAAAVDVATGSDGEIDIDVLSHELINAAVAISLSK